ncbi:MAG TPA: MFS transporter [Actinomycetales bacterium]|nr:MFS transporter [Actinomycetales bacterium]
MTTAVQEQQSLRREQRAWYFYDWANSAYVTTTATVLFVPYLSSVAKAAACPGLASGEVCRQDLSILGIPVAAGSLALYVVTFSTILSAVLLPLVGAIADRTSKKKNLMAGFAWAGAVSASLMFFVTGTNWQLGAGLQFIANICLGASLVVYEAIMVQISAPDERDRVSSRGWALGYLGGGLLLAANLVVVTMHDRFGLSEGEAVRVCLLSAGLWWGLFTLVPYLGIRNRPVVHVTPTGGGLVQQAFGQLAATLRHARGYPQTLLFLVAYLFFNDGIQTVIGSSSLYGQAELGFATSQLIITILLVQFVAFGGALLFGAAAQRYGAKRTVLGGLVMWTVVVTVGFVLPAGKFGLFLALAVGIGIVLGGTQALTRSLYSQMLPKGREAEYFSLYQAAERGTSWFGTFLFGLMFQLTDSYRPAILSLIVFFVIGGALLIKVDIRRGIADAGNEQPRIV